MREVSKDLYTILKASIAEDDTEINEICKRNDELIKQGLSSTDQLGIRKIANAYVGDITNNTSSFIQTNREGERVPIVPLVWQTTETVYMADVIEELSKESQDAKLEYVFPTRHPKAKRTTIYMKTWSDELLQELKPGVPGSGYSSKVRKWSYDFKNYGISLESSVDAFRSPEQVRDIMIQMSLYLRSKHFTFLYLIFRALGAMQEPLLTIILNREQEDAAAKLMIEKWTKDWNAVLNEHPLSTLERNKIEAGKYVGYDGDAMVLLMSATSSLLLRKKTSDMIYGTNGVRDDGTNMTGYNTHPEKDLDYIGKTPILIVNDIKADNFTHEPLTDEVYIGNYYLATNHHLDEVTDTYNINQMSPYVGNYQSANGKKDRLHIKDLFDKSGVFGENEGILLMGSDGIDQKDFLQSSEAGDQKAITYFGDMLNERENGCTTEHFSKLAKTLHLSVLKSMGYTREDEIKLLSKVSKMFKEFDTETAGKTPSDIINDYKPETNQSPHIYYDYKYLSKWANKKVPSDTFTAEKEIAKDYLAYLDDMSTFLEKIYGTNNLLFEKGHDASYYSDTETKELWINRVFFNNVCYFENAEEDINLENAEEEKEKKERFYPLSPAQSKNQKKLTKNTNTNYTGTGDNLQVKDGYKITVQNLEFSKNVLEKNMKDHINAMSKYVSLNTSLGPILLTYLCSKFTKQVIHNMMDSNVAPPFGCLALNIMHLLTEHIYWVKPGATAFKLEGITTTLKDSNIHGFLKWIFNTEMGVGSDDLTQLYKGYNFRIKQMLHGCGIETYDCLEWKKDTGRYAMENDFISKLHEKNSFFSILIPPGINYSDFDNKRFSFKGEDVYSTQKTQLLIPGYARYRGLIDTSGNFKKYDLSHGFNRLFFQGCCEFERPNGKILKLDGVLFHTIEDGAVSTIINNENYITDKINN